MAGTALRMRLAGRDLLACPTDATNKRNAGPGWVGGCSTTQGCDDKKAAARHLPSYMALSRGMRDIVALLALLPAVAAKPLGEPLVLHGKAILHGLQNVQWISSDQRRATNDSWKDGHLHETNLTYPSPLPSSASSSPSSVAAPIRSQHNTMPLVACDRASIAGRSNVLDGAIGGSYCGAAKTRAECLNSYLDPICRPDGSAPSACVGEVSYDPATYVADCSGGCMACVWTGNVDEGVCASLGGGSLLICDPTPPPSRSSNPPPFPPPLPPPPIQRRQNNVLFFVMDDLRPDLNEAYGQLQVITPNLDAFARKSLTFQRAYCQFAHCAPSRQSFLTGRTPQQTKVYNFLSSFRDPGVGEDWVTLPQYFRENGYYTAGGGKLFHSGGSGPDINNDMPYSWDKYYSANNPENPQYYCPITQLYHSVCPSDDTEAPSFDKQLADAAIDELVVARNRGQYWFLGVGFYRPHRPWNAPREFYNLYPNNGIAPTDIALATNKLNPRSMPEIARIANKWPCDQERGACKTLDGTSTFTSNESTPIPDDLAKLGRWGYYASVSYVDSVFGQVMNRLDELHMSSNTVVSVIGDHGWHLGEQGQWCKRTNFEVATRIPMIIHAPYFTGSHGFKTSHVAEAVDLYRTLASLAIPSSVSSTPIQESVSGKDLTPSFVNPTNPLSSVPAYAFSQMSRCPGDGALGTSSSCAKVPLDKISWMGYSVRSEMHRYTLWIPFNGGENTALWDGDESYEELYSYESSQMDDFNSFDRVNVASDPSYSTKKAELRIVLRNKFHPSSSTSPPQLRPPVLPLPSPPPPPPSPSPPPPPPASPPPSSVQVDEACGLNQPFTLTKTNLWDTQRWCGMAVPLGPFNVGRRDACLRYYVGRPDYTSECMYAPASGGKYKCKLTWPPIYPCEVQTLSRR